MKQAKTRTQLAILVQSCVQKRTKVVTQSAELKAALRKLRRSITPAAVQHKAHSDYMRETKVMREAYDAVIGDIQELNLGDGLSAMLQEYPWQYFFTVTCAHDSNNGYWAWAPWVSGHRWGDWVWVPDLEVDVKLRYLHRRIKRDSLALMRDIAEAPGYRRMFVACEPHKYGRNLHAHGLIATPEPAELPWRGPNSGPAKYEPYSPTEFWDKWFHRFGRTRVEPIRGMADVAAYCAKYVCKLTDGDNYDFYGRDDLSWIQ